MRDREYSLDVLKILATVLIMFHHYQQLTGTVFKYINFHGGLFYFGYIVELFFLLSGYFICGYIKKIQNGLRFPEFFIRRYLRLLPLQALSAFTYFFLYMIYRYVSTGYWNGAQSDLWGTVVTALGLQVGWGFRNPLINNPTWYISVLLLCYVVFYVIVYWSSKKKFSWAYLCVLMILFGAWINTNSADLLFPDYKIGRGFYSFFTGILLGYVLKQNLIPAKWNKSLTILSLIIAVGFPVLVCLANDLFPYGGAAYILSFLYYPALIWLFRTAPLHRFFDHAWIGTLGRISFNVYVWHTCAIMGLRSLAAWGLLPFSIKSLQMMLLFTLVMFGFGAISHFYLELPISRKVDQLKL